MNNKKKNQRFNFKIFPRIYFYVMYVRQVHKSMKSVYIYFENVLLTFFLFYFSSKKIQLLWCCKHEKILFIFIWSVPSITSNCW